MSQIKSLISATKRLLKSQGLTYRDVANALEISEPSVKRMFASERLTLERLTQVGELMGFTLAELLQEADSSIQRIRTLNEEQESFLVSDTKLLLTAVCALNHWKMADIVAAYQLTDAECMQCLLHLDRLRLIELLPGNRIRIIVARDFDWLPDGPIRRLFRSQAQDDFLDSSFTEQRDSMNFVYGMLTETAYAQFQSELRRLRRRFSELHEESLSSPLAVRKGAAVLLAARLDWEPAAFASLRRLC